MSLLLFVSVPLHFCHFCRFCRFCSLLFTLILCLSLDFGHVSWFIFFHFYFLLFYIFFLFLLSLLLLLQCMHADCQLLLLSNAKLSRQIFTLFNTLCLSLSLSLYVVPETIAIYIYIFQSISFQLSYPKFFFLFFLIFFFLLLLLFPSYHPLSILSYLPSHHIGHTWFYQPPTQFIFFSHTHTHF